MLWLTVDVETYTHWPEVCCRCDLQNIECIPLLSFSLCLSRACLGIPLLFMRNWRTNGVLRTERREGDTVLRLQQEGQDATAPF
eukprot:COSAG06_NODE_4350_length_4342_cov_1.776337_5_plen_84_part_00